MGYVNNNHLFTFNFAINKIFLIKIVVELFCY